MKAAKRHMAPPAGRRRFTGNFPLFYTAGIAGRGAAVYRKLALLYGGARLYERGGGRMGTYELEETSAGRAGGLRKRAAACLLDLLQK